MFHSLKIVSCQFQGMNCTRKLDRAKYANHKAKTLFFILRNIKRKVKTIAVVFSMFYFLVKLVSYSKRNEYFTILGLEKHEVIFLDANDANRQGDS